MKTSKTINKMIKLYVSEKEKSHKIHNMNAMNVDDLKTHISEICQFLIDVSIIDGYGFNEPKTIEGTTLVEFDLVYSVSGKPDKHYSLGLAI